MIEWILVQNFKKVQKKKEVGHYKIFLKQQKF